MSINLIDLSVEGTNLLDCGSSSNNKQLKSSPSNQNTTINNYLFTTNNDFINPAARDSLDNNPFDKIQKQIDLLGDPFESVEITASNSNSKHDLKNIHEVRTENLLSLQEDDILTLTPGTSATKDNFSGLSELSKNSPDFQSTPISLNISSTPQKPSLMKNKLKNNLLKLSISNASSYLSSRRDSKTSDEDSPTTIIKSKGTINLINSLTSSRDDSCDDLMNIKPNWIDSETDCESDIEMMKIPMLDKIDDKVSCSPNHEQTEFRSRFNSEGSISHFAAIRAKMINRKSVEKSENKSIDEMNEIINEFKNIILERNVKPSSVIESLKNALANEETSSEKIQANSEITPPSIIRQGTFDIELEDASHLPDADKHICVNETNIDIKDMDYVFQTPSPNQQNFNTVFEQLGKFFEGTPNVNIVQSNLTHNANNPTPTYIVLMNTSQAADKNFEKDIEPTTRRRSQSLSMTARRPSANKLQQKPKTSPPKIVPPKLIRRNSMASTYTPQPQPRRSISNLNSRSLTMHNSLTTSNLQRKSTVSNSKTQMAMDLQANRLKFKSNNYGASRGPLKATIPIRNLAKAITKTPSKNCENLDKLNICTPVSRPAFPKASSTPMVMTPDVNLLRRNRSGFLSSPKSTLALTNRRRTMTAAGSTTEIFPRPKAVTKPQIYDNNTTKNANGTNRFNMATKSKLIKNKENHPTGQ